MMYFSFFAVILAGYLLGSINSSLVVGKFYGVDVRNYGSGNAGATNVLRTLGKTAAVFTGLGDVLKGVLAVIIGWWLGGEYAAFGGMAGGLASIIGHNWPVYFGFRGGKGIFTSAAVVFMIDYRLGLALLAVFVVIVAVTRYISLGSVMAAALLPVAALFFNRQAFAFALITGLLAVYRHRSNIRRLLQGTESKLGSKAKMKQESNQ